METETFKRNEIRGEEIPNISQEYYEEEKQRAFS